MFKPHDDKLGLFGSPCCGLWKVSYEVHAYRRVQERESKWYADVVCQRCCFQIGKNARRGSDKLLLAIDRCPATIVVSPREFGNS